MKQKNPNWRSLAPQGFLWRPLFFFQFFLFLKIYYITKLGRVFGDIKIKSAIKFVKIKLANYSLCYFLSLL